MTTTQLISKLDKMNVSHEVINSNDFNFDIRFKINGSYFQAGYTANSNVITDFCKELFYCNSDQETKYRFYSNFSQLLKSNF
jgi:hypothetical protein